MVHGVAQSDGHALKDRATQGDCLPSAEIEPQDTPKGGEEIDFVPGMWGEVAKMFDSWSELRACSGCFFGFSFFFPPPFFFPFSPLDFDFVSWSMRVAKIGGGGGGGVSGEPTLGKISLSWRIVWARCSRMDGKSAVSREPMKEDKDLNTCCYLIEYYYSLFGIEYRGSYDVKHVKKE